MDWDWPYFTPTGGIAYGNFDASTPTNEDPLLCDPSCKTYPDMGPLPPIVINHTTDSTPNQGKSPSLVTENHSSGNASASPFLLWDTIDVFSENPAITLIQRVTTAKDVESVVSNITRHTWLLSEPRLSPFRLAAARLFSDTWDPACGNIFLDFNEEDVLLLKRYLPLTSSPTQRDTNTTRGSVIARLYGSLFKADIVTSDDFVVACEMLLEHHRRPTYIQGLWELITSAGEEACQKVSLQHILAIRQTLKEAECESSLHEVEYYADLIIRSIDSFVLSQAEKTKAALREEKREQRRRKPKLRKPKEELQKIVRELMSSGVWS